MAMEDLAFIKGFCRLCDDGFKQGWHERNGGNLTYRMTDEEVAEAKPFFEEPREWVKMGVRGENLAGQYFVSTGSGKYMRNVLVLDFLRFKVFSLFWYSRIFALVFSISLSIRSSFVLP